MLNPRIIAKISGGEGSWLAARTYIDLHRPEQFEILFTDTLIEDQDTYRFLIAGAANLFGITLPPNFIPEISDFPAWEDRYAYKAFIMDLAARARDLMPCFHWIADGRDPFDAYESARYLGNSKTDPCSRILKRDLSDRWLRENCDPAETIVIVGIDDTERARFEGSERLGTRGLRAQMADTGWRFVAPLIDHPLMPWQHSRECSPLILAAGLWRQRLVLLGFSHSNCGGHCCKGGQGHWKLMLSVFPERYAYVEWREQQIRVVLGDVSMLTDRRKQAGDLKIIKRPLTLKTLRHRTLTDEEAEDVGRCSCTFYEAEVVYVEKPCQFCNDTGWIYAEIELGPCGCPAGDIPAEIDELINGPRASEDLVAESRAAEDPPSENSSEEARKG